jgi:signal transduction histidine kinase
LTLRGIEEPDLVREVLSLNRGDHLCLVYEDDPLEQMPALLPYFQQGLQANEQCIYVADDLQLSQLQSLFEGFGIDTETRMREGSLLLWTREEWRQPGELDSAKKAAQVRELIANALAAGFDGIRFGIEMTWTLGPDVDAGRLRHWEATINTIFTPEVPGRIICQYSRRRLSPSTIEAALSTHPIAIVGPSVTPNPFYDAPGILARGKATGEEKAGLRADWMLSQLRWVRAFQQEREQRIRAEAALKEAEASKERIEELYRASQALTEELKAVNAGKDEFLGLVSHELRTPTTTIYGGLRLLETRRGQLPAETVDELIETASEEAARLVRLIENLLTLARLQLGQEIDLELLSLNVLVADAVKKFTAANAHRPVNLVLGDSLPPVMASAPYVEQIIANLLSNADKYSAAGAQVDVTASIAEDKVQVIVRDRGPGVAPGEEERIFEGFYRSERTATIASGQGLGLTVCRRLIEALGGQTWAANHPDGGLEVRFSLPAVVGDSASDALAPLAH